MKSELINIRPDARVKSNGCHGTLEREEWRPIKGYEGLYEVSSFGRVKGLAREWFAGENYLAKRTKPETIIKPFTDAKGYQMVGLSKGKGARTFYKVHRLVMDAFVPNPDNLPQVNHRNEVKTANYPDNMEWCTAKYNNNYGGRKERARLSLLNREDLSKSVCQLTLNGLLIKIWQSLQETERNGFERHRVADCCNGIKKTYRDFIWIYENEYDPNKTYKEEPNTLGKRPVYQLTQNGEIRQLWSSAKEAETDGFRVASVIRCCLGVRKTYKGFIWKYKSDYENEQHQ